MRKLILSMLLMVGVAAPMAAQTQLSVYGGIVTTDDNQIAIGTSLAFPVVGNTFYIVPDITLQHQNSDAQYITTNLSVQARVRPVASVAVYASAGAGTLHTLQEYTFEGCEECSILRRSSTTKPVVEYGLIFTRPGSSMAFRVAHNITLDEIDWFKDNVLQNRFTAGFDWTL